MILDGYGRSITAPVGSIDDGSDQGAIRAHLSTGELVKLPFKDGAYWQENNGGSTHLLSGYTYSPGNSDGSATSLQMSTVDAIALNGGCRITFPFYGTRLGIRFLVLQAFGYAPGFVVDIDGVRYDVRGKADPLIGAHSAYDDEWTWMCPDTLKDHKHLCRISTPGSMVSGHTTTQYFTGMIVEKRPGNGDPIVNRRAQLVATGVLTTTFAAIPIQLTAQNTLSARAVRQVQYYNTDTNARVVQVKLAGFGAIWEMVLAAAGSVGSCQAWPPPGAGDVTLNVGDDGTQSTYWQHKADANSKVQYGVLGVS